MDNADYGRMKFFGCNDIGLRLDNKKGIYPEYHLNKKSWVSIILDDTLTDDEIMSLIDMSYQIVDSKK